MDGKKQYGVWNWSSLDFGTKVGLNCLVSLAKNAILNLKCFGSTRIGPGANLDAARVLASAIYGVGRPFGENVTRSF